MPLSRSAITWLRRTLTWSSSTQSWQERTADLVLIAGILTAACITWAFGLVWWQIALVWILCLAPSIPFSLNGWLKVFGPVLYYDMIRQARRSRFIILRFLYAILLVLLFLAVSLTFSSRQAGTTGTRLAAEIAQTYFEVFMLVQFMTVVLLTPAYVAGAIADEKDRKTLEFMLATDLLNREIVLSKLGSRLANIGLVVLTGLPILSILQFLGGVDPNLIIAGFVVTAMTILGQAGVAIFFSAISRKPRDSITLSYLAVLAYYAVALLLMYALTSAGPRTSTAPTFLDVTIMQVYEVLNAGNLITFIGQVKAAGAAGTLAGDLPRLVGKYSAFHGTVALICTALAIAQLRRAALSHSAVGSSKSKTGPRGKSRPAIGANPMLWKEIFCEGSRRSGWILRILMLVLLVVTFAPVALMLWEYFEYIEVRYYRADQLAEQMNPWVRTANVVVGCLTLLWVGVRASTSITSEREKQTLDTLLTTPMDSSSMLYGKWVGSILTAYFGMIWLAAIWAVGIVSGGLAIQALPCVMIAWLVYAAFAASLGLWYSTVSRTSLRAAVFTIMTMIGLGVGHWLIWMCCLPMAGFGGGREFEWMAKAQLGVLTPPFVMGFFAFSGVEIRDLWEGRDNWWTELAAFCAAGLVFWMILAAVVYSMASTRFRQMTNRRDRMYADGSGSDWIEAQARKPRSSVPMSPWAPPAVNPREARQDDEAL